MKRISALLMICVFLVGSTYGQNMFKHIPKPLNSNGFSVSKISDSEVLVYPTDTTMNSFRFVANLASYGVSLSSPLSTQLLSGGGISYQHLKWDVTSRSWKSVWSVNGLAWYNVPINGQTPSFISYGVAGGFFNNLVLIGVAYNGKQALITAGVGINLN